MWETAGVSASEQRTEMRGPLVLLAATVIIWGTGYWPTAVAADYSPPLLVAGLRLVSSALVLVVAALLMRGQIPRGRLMGWAVVTGLLMVALFHWGITESITRAGAGTSAVLVNTNPLIVLVLAWIFLRERLSPLGIVGLSIGFGGVVLMVSSQLGGNADTSQLLIGSAIALTAALGWAVGVMIVRHLSQQPGGVEMMGFTAVQFIASSIVLIPIGFALEGTSSTNWSSGTFWGSMLWIGPAAGLGVAFFYMALKHLSAAKTSSALFLVPAVAVIVEIARGNAPSALVLVGMVVAVLGVALAVIPQEKLAQIGPRVRRRFGGAPAG